MQQEIALQIRILAPACPVDFIGIDKVKRALEFAGQRFAERYRGHDTPILFTPFNHLEHGLFELRFIANEWAITHRLATNEELREFEQYIQSDKRSRLIGDGLLSFGENIYLKRHGHVKNSRLLRWVASYHKVIIEKAIEEAF